MIPAVAEDEFEGRSRVGAGFTEKTRAKSFDDDVPKPALGIHAKSIAGLDDLEELLRAHTFLPEIKEGNALRGDPLCMSECSRIVLTAAHVDRVK